MTVPTQVFQGVLTFFVCFEGVPLVVVSPRFLHGIPPFFMVGFLSFYFSFSVFYDRGSVFLA